MKISELIKKLKNYMVEYGDIPVVLYDLDTGDYFSLLSKHFEAQGVDDGVRISIGLNSYQDRGEPTPKKRPL